MDSSGAKAPERLAAPRQNRELSGFGLRQRTAPDGFSNCGVYRLRGVDVLRRPSKSLAAEAFQLSMPTLGNIFRDQPSIRPYNGFRCC